MKFTIERSKWLRGQDAHVINDDGHRAIDSYLYRARDGKMCCLGFLSIACGYEQEQIKNITDPSEVVCTSKDDRYPPTIFHTEDDLSDEVEDLMDINDSRDFSEYEREEKVKEKFAALDIEVEFVD